MEAERVLGELQRVEANVTDVVTKGVIAQGRRDWRPWQSNRQSSIVGIGFCIHGGAAMALVLGIATDEWVEVTRRELLNQGLTSSTVLRYHGGERDHGKAAVVDLGQTLFFRLLLGKLVDASEERRVAIVLWEGQILALNGTTDRQDLEPALHWDLAHSLNGGRNVREAQTCRW